MLECQIMATGAQTFKSKDFNVSLKVVFNSLRDKLANLISLFNIGISWKARTSRKVLLSIFSNFGMLFMHSQNMLELHHKYSWPNSSFCLNCLSSSGTQVLIIKLWYFDLLYWWVYISGLQTFRLTNPGVSIMMLGHSWMTHQFPWPKCMKAVAWTVTITIQP